jgi:ATP-dependent Clp protease adaptor protein ClpS
MTSEMTLSLYLKNDSYNSFLTVTAALMRVMNYEQLQAEQITHLVHYRGEMVLRSGNYVELEGLKMKLEEMGLTAEIK